MLSTGALTPGTIRSGLFDLQSVRRDSTCPCLASDPVLILIRVGQRAFLLRPIFHSGIWYRVSFILNESTPALVAFLTRERGVPLVCSSCLTGLARLPARLCRGGVTAQHVGVGWSNPLSHAGSRSRGRA